MSGIHVIETIPIKELTETGYALIIFGILIAVCSLILFTKMNSKRKKDKGAAFVIVGYLLGVFMMIYSICCMAETGRYTYTCTFDDTVKLNDVSEIYDIISFKDGVWTIKDK